MVLGVLYRRCLGVTNLNIEKLWLGSGLVVEAPLWFQVKLDYTTSWLNGYAGFLISVRRLMDNLLEILEPIKQMIISRLYGICECGSLGCQEQAVSADSKADCIKTNQSCEKPQNPSYESLAEELSVRGDPLGLLRYASSHRANTLVFTEDDILELEQSALRDLALGRKGRKVGEENG